MRGRYRHHLQPREMPLSVIRALEKSVITIGRIEGCRTQWNGIRDHPERMTAFGVAAIAAE